MGTKLPNKLIEKDCCDSLYGLIYTPSYSIINELKIINKYSPVIAFPFLCPIGIIGCSDGKVKKIIKNRKEDTMLDLSQLSGKNPRVKVESITLDLTMGNYSESGVSECVYRQEATRLFFGILQRTFGIPSWDELLLGGFGLATFYSSFEDYERDGPKILFDMWGKPDRIYTNASQRKVSVAWPYNQKLCLPGEQTHISIDFGPEGSSIAAGEVMANLFHNWHTSLPILKEGLILIRVVGIEEPLSFHDVAYSSQGLNMLVHPQLSQIKREQIEAYLA